MKPSADRVEGQSTVISVTDDGLRYYRSPLWPQLKHGIFTRHGGHSPAPWASLNVGGTVGDDRAVVRRNHERMYEALNVDGTRACTTWQVHGADVVTVQGPVRGRRWLAQADGLVTDRPDTPLVMRYADCVPLLFHDPARGVIGLAHAGWRGTVMGMAANMVRVMAGFYGCHPADIQVLIGPSISRQRFQVGPEVVAAIQEYFGTLEGLHSTDPQDGSSYVDLWAANALDLRRAGVEQVAVAGLCTYQRTDEFFSHRAEHGRTGRFGVVMSL